LIIFLTKSKDIVPVISISGYSKKTAFLSCLFIIIITHQA
jgi:hypothetical protein